MLSWIVWLIVAAVLGVAELLTTTLAFGLIAVAAVVAAVVGTFDLGLAFQLAADHQHAFSYCCWNSASLVK